MDKQLIKGWLSVESVVMLTTSALLFIFLVSCIVCLYFVHRCNEVTIKPHCSPVDQHPTSERTSNTENEPKIERTELKIMSQSRTLASNPSRKLEVIIEIQDEDNLSIAKL